MGEGIVAFVLIRGQNGFEAICADNRNLVGWIVDTWIKDRDLPILEAQFQRRGEIFQEPSWIIETTDHQVKATWKKLEPPVIAYRGADLEDVKRRSIFNVLFFANDAEITLDGVRVEGRPYVRGVWRDNIGGGDRSSCVFALAETFVTPERS